MKPRLFVPCLALLVSCAHAPGPAPETGKAREAIAKWLPELEAVRGLRAKTPIVGEALGAEEFKRLVAREIDAKIDADEIREADAVMIAAGFLGPGQTTETYIRAAHEEQLGGFYDEERKRLFLRDDLARFSGETSEQDLALVHEMTHALQDQHFDLAEHLAQDDPGIDPIAFQSLAEGDAMLAMALVAARKVGIDPGIAAARLARMIGLDAAGATGEASVLTDAPIPIRKERTT